MEEQNNLPQLKKEKLMMQKKLIMKSQRKIRMLKLVIALRKRVKMD